MDIVTQTQRNEKGIALVLGEDTRSFLCVIRSLGRAGYKVHVVCYNKTSPTLKSKYISAIYNYNYQAYQHQQWIDNVLCLVERYQYDIIFPCDERAIYPLWNIRNQLPSKTKLAIANEKSLDILFDKWKTKEIAKECQIPVANGKLLSLAQHSYQNLMLEFGENFVVKPLQSFEKSSLNKRNKVAIIHSESDLKLFKQSNDETEKYLIEEYFTGVGEGLSIFAWQGKVITAFAYKRLAEPKSGGGSSYRQSTSIDLEQLHATKLICNKTRLNGLAMFEFKRNIQNKWILVEVNARVWGGLPLAEYAGIDFPKLYIDHLIKGEATKQIVPHKIVRARALTADLYEIKRESEQLIKTSTKKRAVLHIAKRMSEITTLFSSKESIDSFRFDDPKPFFSEVLQIANTFANPLLKRSVLFIKFKRVLTKRKIKQLFINNPQRRILFLCYGNIIRSSFAENYIKNKINGMQTKSFGVHKTEMRKSPEIAIQAALNFQCDLSSHSSKCLNQTDLKETDIIFYFDEKNKVMINSFYNANIAICLADLLDNDYPSLSEIDDPYESDVETINQCYSKVKNGLDNFINIYQEATQC